MNRLSSVFRRIRKASRSPEGVFALIAGIFGSLIIMAAIPFTGADEEAHFVRAYGVSSGDFVMAQSNETSIPKSFRQTIGCFQEKVPVVGVLYQYTYEEYGSDKKDAFRCALNLPLDETDTELVATSASFYSPTSYIPQAIVISIGRLFDAPIAALGYLMRFSVLAAYILLVGVAIRLLPVRKWAIMGVALLPVSVIQVTNPGADYMLLGLAAILIAVVVRSVYLPKDGLRAESAKLMTLLAAASVLIMLPKGFFPGICFLPLILFYGGLKFRLPWKIGVLVLALVVGYIWQAVGAPELTGQSTGTSSSIASLPADFIRTMFYRWTDTDFVYIGDVVKNFYFSDLGAKAGMPALAITFMNILFALYIFVGYPEKLVKSKISSRDSKLLIITGLTIATSVIFGSFAALYIASSDLQDGSGTIRGVQTRYFYTVFLLLAALPFVRYFQAKSESLFRRCVVIGSTMLLSTNILVLMFQFDWLML